MPKKKVKEKPEQQILLEAEYRRVRINTKQNIRRLAARGYDVSGIIVPKIPEKITAGSIRRLEELNQKRYKLSTHEMEVLVESEEGIQTYETRVVKGTTFNFHERQASNKKAVDTRKKNKANKAARIEKSVEETTKKYSAESLKSSEDFEARRIAHEQRKRERDMLESWTYSDDDSISDEELQNKISNLEYEARYIDETPDQVKARILDTYTNEEINDFFDAEWSDSNTDYYNGEYSIDPETGSVKKTSELTAEDTVGKIWSVLTSQETAENIVKKALEDLDVMIQYSGTSDTGKRIHGFNKVITTQNNAQMIKDYIVEHLKTEPDRVVAVLRNMMDEEGFHTVDYMYSSGGYQRFLKYYNSAFVFQDIEDED